MDIKNPDWPQAYYLQFCTNKQIWEDKFPLIKQAIEQVINSATTQPKEEDKQVEEKIPDWMPSFVQQMVKDAFAKEIMEAEQKAFYAAKEIREYDTFPKQSRYPTFAHYHEAKQKLNPTMKKG